MNIFLDRNDIVNQFQVMTSSSSILHCSKYQLTQLSYLLSSILYTSIMSPFARRYNYYKIPRNTLLQHMEKLAISPRYIAPNLVSLGQTYGRIVGPKKNHEPWGLAPLKWGRG